jgi:hypothetical protein
VLIAAVIGQAVRDLAAKRGRDAARRWIASDSRRAFGFVFCCEALGIEPSWARRQIENKKTFAFCGR